MQAYIPWCSFIIQPKHLNKFVINYYNFAINKFRCSCGGFFKGSPDSVSNVVFLLYHGRQKMFVGGHVDLLELPVG
ncbi:hypothetical protein CWN49_28310 [Klebsiella michiganensis]|uniref:Uncharacterized protein n=1 Tax=Klebsiella michiganensis TaxID=1134687 RepID=A0A2J5PB75_9ENTR|nr:hypothetical protein CWN49_28310 [Klebsiella michiganensis]